MPSCRRQLSRPPTKHLANKPLRDPSDSRRVRGGAGGPWGQEGLSEPQLRSSLMRILDFSFDGGTENVTKWYSNWSPGLILGEFCTIFRAGPVWRGLGAKFGRKTAENRPKL